jgi:hypothetical protein
MKNGLGFGDVGVNFLLQREKLHYVIFFPTMSMAIKKKNMGMVGTSCVFVVFYGRWMWCMFVYYFERTMNCEG